MSDTNVDPWAGYDLKPASASTPAPAKDDPWAGYDLKPEPKSPGVVSKIVDAGKAAVSAVVGENEFDHPEIGSAIAKSITPDNALSPEGKKNAELVVKLYQSRNEPAMLDILRKEDPQLKESADKFGNKVVTFKGTPYYLNKGGISERDVTEFGRDAMLTAPFSMGAGALLKGVALPFRAGGQAVAGGAGSLAADAVSAKAGGDQGIDVPALIASVIGGAGGEMAGSAIGSLINVVKTNPTKYVANGQLTQEGQRIFAAAGFDPADISAKVADEFAKRARKTGGNEATAREVAANEFGIPLTRGQATGDFDTIAFENSARAGARGEMAGNIVRGRFARQDEAIEAAKGTVADEIAPLSGVKSPQDAAGVVLQGVRQRADESAEGVSEAYEQAARMSKGAAVKRDAITGLPDIVRTTLRAEGLRIPEGSKIFPGANAAMEVIERLGALDVGELTTKSGSAVSPKGVALEAIELIRREIGGKDGILSAAKNEADKVRIRGIVRGFDKWLDDVADNALMSGDTDAVVFLKAARQKAARDFEKFGLRDVKDDAGRVIERMTDMNVTEQEVANFLYGSTKTGDSGRAYRVARRIAEIAGKDSDEWDAIRRGTFLKIATEAEGKTQPGAQAVSQNIFEFINGKGRTLAEELFSKDEIAKMRRFATTLKTTVPPPGSTNYSGSGYEAARALGDIFNVNAPFYIRIFGLVGKAKNTMQALPAGAPKTRSGPNASVPSIGAISTERYLTPEDE